MKSTMLPLFLIGLLFAVPALSQGNKNAPAIGKQVEALQKQVDEQKLAIEKLTKRAEASRKASEQLAKQLKAARKGGFTFPAPNISAREALLGGLESYAAAESK